MAKVDMPLRYTSTPNSKKKIGTVTLTPRVPGPISGTGTAPQSRPSFQPSLPQVTPPKRPKSPSANAPGNPYGYSPYALNARTQSGNVPTSYIPPFGGNPFGYSPYALNPRTQSGAVPVTWSGNQPSGSLPPGYAPIVQPNGSIIPNLFSLQQQNQRLTPPGYKSLYKYSGLGNPLTYSTGMGDLQLLNYYQKLLEESALETPTEEGGGGYYSPFYYGGGYGGGGGGSYTTPYDFFFNLLNWRI